MRGGPYTVGRLPRLWRAVCRVVSTPRQGGFTIIEVMIVLVISSALFISAVVLISGRQNQTAFDQSVRKIQAEIQQTINEVATGYFPKIGSFNCSAGAGGPTFSTLVDSAQGTNSGCIFLGKAMQFDVGGTNPEQFRVLTIAALQKAGAQEASTYALAQPKVVAPVLSAMGNPDASTVGTMQNGVTTYEMYFMNGAVKTSVGAMAFVTSLAQYSGGAVISGSQQVSVVPILTSLLNDSPPKVGEAINTTLPTSPVNPAEGVNICFVSGTTNQSGLIKVGGNNRELSVKLDIKNNKTCA